METKNEYKTKQRDIILELLAENADRHLTASEISAMLEGEGKKVGLATLYRYLEKLCERGVVQKISLPKESARYTYSKEEDPGHFHLKCTECGMLTCARCGKLEELCRHIGSDHGFSVALGSTTFYGKCEDCRKAQEERR